MKTQEKGRKEIVDIQTARNLMQVNPMKIYKVNLGKGVIVEMRLHLASLKGEKIKDLKSAQECFTEGWNAAMKGHTKPISELWNNI